MAGACWGQRGRTEDCLFEVALGPCGSVCEHLYARAACLGRYEKLEGHYVFREIPELKTVWLQGVF